MTPGSGRGRERATESYWRLGLALLLALALLIGALPMAGVTRAASYSCDEVGLDAAIAAGGDATFACVVATTITTSGTKTLSNTTTPTTLDGGGLLTISGNNTHQVFTIASDVTATFRNLTITGGNSIIASGGGINNGGTLTLDRVTVSGNTTSNTNGAPPGISGDGGGIYNTGTLTLTDTTISGNTASASGSGGLPSFGGNGGGLYNGGTLTLDRVTVSGNTASNTNGGIPGSFSFGGDGGGIYNNGTATLTDVTVSGNTASNTNSGTLAPLSDGGEGGGIFNNGDLTLTNSTISNNGANLTSTVDVGFGGNGGGIQNSGFATLTNVTLSGNTASSTTTTNSGRGGGINSGGLPPLREALVAAPSGIVTLRNTIVAAPAGATTCAGLIIDELGNRQYNATAPADTACGATIPTGDPKLAPLANNGGTTQTQLPATDSPVLGAAVAANCPATDQRGVPRPQGAGCDSGAVELLGEAAVTAVATVPDPIVAGTGGIVALNVTGSNFIQGITALTINGGTSINGGPITVIVTSPTTLTATINAFPAGSAGQYTVGATNVPYVAPGGTTSTVAITVIAPTVAQSVVTASIAAGGGTISPVGATAFPTGGQATYTATPNEGRVFLGWTLDGQFVGFASPLTFAVNGDRTLVATFAPRPTFSDVAPPGAAWEAITQLAARGIINGYSADECASRGLAAPCYGPADPVARAQIAALIVRAFGWDAERPRGPSPFADLGGVDAELQRAILILARRGIVVGYGDGTYGPLDGVTHAQAVSFIARSMVQAGHWTPVTQDDGAAFPDLPASSPHRLDLLTYAKYAGSPPERPSGWGAGANRAWTAQALWQALASHFGVDRVP